MEDKKDKNKEISKVDVEKILKILVDHLKKEHQYSDDEVHQLLEKTLSLEDQILPTVLPVSIFASKMLSSLEASVVYLKEARHLRFSQIAKLLNRDQRTVWTTYAKAKTKSPTVQTVQVSEEVIPIVVIASRRHSVLESIALHLKENNFSNKKIAQLLAKDESTIWTVLHRAAKKP